MADFWLKVDKTLRYHGRQVLRQWRSIVWQINKPIAENPIFIVGCSRAGTTLVYKTFSESDDLGTLQRETHDFWAELHPLQERNWDSHQLSEKDIEEGDRAIISEYFFRFTGTLQFVDKNNQNGLCIPYLHALFPNARFVYVKRSPGDNINSLIEGWGKADEFAHWSDELPEEVNIDDGRYKRWCFFLMPGWRNYLNASIEDVCAAQYIAMNEAILDARKVVPDSHWVEICYEDILRDPVNGFKQAFQKMNVRFSSKLENHCKNVLQNPYNAFSEIRLDKWKEGRNRDRIEKILPMVRSVSSRMDYE